ncbi:MAG: hypothetical protein J7641_01425 [Cyanobacteria bacterium SID2]|nr:hypothetical protein [Cyanobacteria bacterium SID2]MBP0005771.1 hypothetical protein [Cyanobacteria bacterium SBC]
MKFPGFLWGIDGNFGKLARCQKRQPLQSADLRERLKIHSLLFEIVCFGILTDDIQDFGEIRNLQKNFTRSTKKGGLKFDGFGYLYVKACLTKLLMCFLFDALMSFLFIYPSLLLFYPFFIFSSQNAWNP